MEFLHLPLRLRQIRAKHSRVVRSLFVALLLIPFLTIRPASAGKNIGLPDPLVGVPAKLQPEVGPSIPAYVFNGDLRDLAAAQSLQDLAALEPQPFKYTPGTEPKGASSTLSRWVDPAAQTAAGAGQMPAAAMNIGGMNLAAGGNGWPPDTNGDVGPNHYIQVVNTSIAVFDKTSGALLSGPLTFNAFFKGTNTPCDFTNKGDPVVVYDRFAGRWLVTDFAWFTYGSLDSPPYYECVAVSQSSDPVSGGWYMYAIPVSNTALNDYPKLGVWRDGYYFSFNMFKVLSGGIYSWDGTKVLAIDKSKVINGQATPVISFSLNAASNYANLLPSHALSLPPSGAAAYFASLAPPDQLQLWKFKADWATPANSTFSGPTILDVADFAIAASVPQKNSSALVDSLSYRPMMQLIYRQVGGVEALWLNHTVANQGIGGMRWYELRNPATSPSIFQQGTYQPDNHHRWMGSLAVDQDGNLAAGYSVSSASMYPAIRYAGRLADETHGLLPQAEATLIQGNGSQYSRTRWGDYSSMSVDPTDECTFWYTTEYFPATSDTWYTRIGSFKFPSCGQPKGTLQGTIRDSQTLLPITGVKIILASAAQTLTLITDAQGKYNANVMGGSFTVTAGPLTPAYPAAASISAVGVTSGNTTMQDLQLVPAPYLAEYSNTLDDSVPGGNNNDYPEPGENGLLLWEDLQNIGAAASTGITAKLTSLTPGVTISVPLVTYPDIQSGQHLLNLSPFVFSIDQSVPCGADLQFQKTVTDSLTSYIINFSLNASTLMARSNIFSDSVENGQNGWSTGGTNNTWAVTSQVSHTTSHAWSDSPSGNYADDSESYLRSKTFNMNGLRHVQISLWTRYQLEPGYDYVYLDYSLDGGSSWSDDGQALLALNAFQDTWQQLTVDASVLDGQPNVALRFRLVSDGGVNYDGISIDDISLSYEPYACFYGMQPVAYFPLVYSR